MTSGLEILSLRGRVGPARARTGQACHGAALHTAGHDPAAVRHAQVRHGMPSPCAARLHTQRGILPRCSEAQSGLVGRGAVRQGRARRSRAWRGKHTASFLGGQQFAARQGVAGPGADWPGKVRQGEASHTAFFFECRSEARHDPARHGVAGQCSARHGSHHRPIGRQFSQETTQEE